MKNWFGKFGIKNLNFKKNTKAPAKKGEENVGKNYLKLKQVAAKF
jgi:hypothetical protein